MRRGLRTYRPRAVLSAGQQKPLSHALFGLAGFLQLASDL